MDVQASFELGAFMCELVACICLHMYTTVCLSVRPSVRLSLCLQGCMHASMKEGMSASWCLGVCGCSYFGVGYAKFLTCASIYIQTCSECPYIHTDIYIYRIHTYIMGVCVCVWLSVCMCVCVRLYIC